MEKSTRYMVEHMLLPAALYNDGSALLSEIISAPGIVLERMYAEAASACGEQLSFDSNSVSVTNQEFHTRSRILSLLFAWKCPLQILFWIVVLFICVTAKGEAIICFSHRSLAVMAGITYVGVIGKIGL